jgi:hypothetical protein
VGEVAQRDKSRAILQMLSEKHSLTRSIKPYELVSDENLELLEINADTILEEIGVEIRDYPSAIERFKKQVRSSMEPGFGFQGVCAGRLFRPRRLANTRSTLEIH